MAENYNRHWGSQRGGGDVVYGLGVIGALVYYIGQAHGFGAVIVAILKGLVWPAFVIYQLLQFLNH